MKKGPDTFSVPSIMEPDPDGGGGSQQPSTTNFGYDKTGNRTSVTDPVNRVSTSTYNAAGWLTQTFQAATHRVNYEYYDTGFVSAVTDHKILPEKVAPVSLRTAYLVDDCGRVIETTDEVGRKQTFGYNAAGENVTWAAWKDGVIEDSAISEFDAQHRLVTTTSSNAGAVSYVYDPRGNLTSVTDGLGHATSYVFNNMSWITSMTTPASAQGQPAPTTYFGYDNNGKLVREVRGKLVTLYASSNGSVGCIKNGVADVCHLLFEPRGRPRSRENSKVSGPLNRIVERRVAGRSGL